MEEGLDRRAGCFENRGRRRREAGEIEILEKKENDHEMKYSGANRPKYVGLFRHTNIWIGIYHQSPTPN